MVRAPELILANRAYLDHDEAEAPGRLPRGGTGGLVAAVRSVIAPWDGERGTTWIGAGRGPFDRLWTDAAGREVIATAHGPLHHRRLFFDDETWEAHYSDVANSFFWPLLHLAYRPLPDLAPYYPAPITPRASQWRSFREVNDAFARAAMEEPAQTCWVHDYQLALVPAFLRAARYPGPVGFFLHTPMPSMAVAARYLDAAGRLFFAEWVQGCLGADLVGLQTEADAERFREAAVSLCGLRAIPGGVSLGHREIRVAAYPVGMDATDVLDQIDAPLPEAFRPARDSGLPLVVGVERCDYTKGIPERLQAIAQAFASGNRFAYIGIAAPTRDAVPAYRRLQERIDEIVHAIRPPDEGVPFVFRREAVPWEGVVALLREADVVFTSSLADGMNLVPLQAVLAQSERPQPRRATILTGDGAGVSHALPLGAVHGLVRVDPFDIAGLEWRLGEALAGLPGRISDELVSFVRTHDARTWATSFLEDLEAATC